MSGVCFRFGLHEVDGLPERLASLVPPEHCERVLCGLVGLSIEIRDPRYCPTGLAGQGGTQGKVSFGIFLTPSVEVDGVAVVAPQFDGHGGPHAE